jgi:type VI secretion system protein ImpA
MSTALPEALWAPIAPDDPGGPDLALAPELDEIRAARRGEDDGLTQGDWVRPLKAPQWPLIRDRCETILARSSKDLQVACWYAEALTMLEGFGGLKLGLEVLGGLIDRFWDTCHPVLDGDGAEARIGRLDWLDLNLSQAVQQIPLTAGATGGLPWMKWEEARTVDNLGLRNPQARDEAIDEGKISGEVFHKAALASGGEFYQALQPQAEAARAACQALQATLELRFGIEGPGLEAVAEAIGKALDVVVQTRQKLFPPGPADAPAQAPPGPGAPAPAHSGPIRSRSEAILTLRTAAAYFHNTEPHSPVAFLVERAAAWAEMPLDSWLGEVIKDPATLVQVRELLNLKKDGKPP